MKRVGVVVLGDLGRSPRMLYHTMSLVKNGFQVDLIGYSGSSLPQEIVESKKIHVKNIHQVPMALINKGPKLVRYVIKAFLQSLFLLFALPLFSHLDWLLVQTPPGVPTIPVLAVYCFLKGTRLVIDFHNYSHTILAMSCGPKHPLVLVTHMIEKYAARLAHHAAFCVTRAMKDDLFINWGITATVLHDRPPSQFHPISLSEKHDLLARLSEQYPALAGGSEDESESTALTTKDGEGNPVLKNNRPGLVVSSTSWTEDEDFSIFLAALKIYDSKVEEKGLPDLLCVITGKGDLKEYYLGKIAESNLQHVQVITPWLEIEDYPRMLASADLGVSLHTSSSGLDLPMKVVDMFGSGLPVAAVYFNCIGELVEDGINGFTFEDSSELSNILSDWFTGFPSNPSPMHQEFRERLREFRVVGWDQNWRENALPVFKDGGTNNSFFVMLFFVGLFLFLSSLVPTVV